MKKRLWLLVVLVLLVPGTAEPKTVTVAELVASIRGAAEAVDFESINGERSAELDEELAHIERASAPASPGAMGVAHRRQRAHALKPGDIDDPALQDAIDRAREIVNIDMRPAIEEYPDPDKINEILQAFHDYHGEILKQSLARNLEAVGRYERKYGPGTPELNGLEFLLNYSLQGVDAFGVDDFDRPGPLEIVAAYDTAYLTAVDDEAELISVAEFGIRYYIFAEGWGGEGVAGLLKPGYVALGVAVAGEDDGPFARPWAGETRVGGFVSWGNVKFAYVSGDEARFMVSREVELIPWLF